MNLNLRVRTAIGAVATLPCALTVWSFNSRGTNWGVGAAHRLEPAAAAKTSELKREVFRLDADSPREVEFTVESGAIIARSPPRTNAAGPDSSA